MKTFVPLAVATGLFSLAAAQVYPVVNPDDIDERTRIMWCTQQRASCLGLCQDQTKEGASTNDCYEEDLSFACVCEDGSSPNATEYSLAIPYLTCQRSVQACADNCKGDTACASRCFTGKSCGATDPTRVNVTTTTTSTGPSATATDGSDSDDSDSDSDPFDDKGSMGSRVMSFGSVYGVGVMAIGIAAGFIGLL